MMNVHNKVPIALLWQEQAVEWAMLQPRTKNTDDPAEQTPRKQMMRLLTEQCCWIGTKNMDDPAGGAMCCCLLG